MLISGVKICYFNGVCGIIGVREFLNLGDTSMKDNRIKIKTKKRLKFRHIYALIMVAVTAYLGYFVLDMLVLTPMNATGIILGMRMDEHTPLEISWLRDAEVYGEALEDVESVTVFWNSGPVVYVIVRVDEGVGRGDARRRARSTVEHFIELSDGVASTYDIQVVVTQGDVSEQFSVNQAGIREHIHEEELREHVHQYNYEFVQAVLAHAEAFPSEANVERARANIVLTQSRLRPSILIVAGDAGLAELIRRVESIEIATAEEGADMPAYPRSHQIPQSSIARFPNWGTWDNDRGNIIWNP